MKGSSTFRLPSRFDFSFHSEFTRSSELLLEDKASDSIELDFSQVNYLDSSALGMLVLLHKKNKAAARQKALKIRGAEGMALEILNMANMHKLYDLV